MQQSVPTEPAVCPVCGPSVGADWCFNASDRLHGLGGDFSYSRCRQCGVLFQNPRVRPDAALDVYPQGYIAHVPMQPRKGFQAVAKDAMRWLRGASLPRQVSSGLGPASRVLDVGCGAGEFLNDVRSKFGCQVVGLDLSEGSKQAAKAGFGIDVFCGALDASPWAPGSFDLVTSWWSLEHMPEPEAALSKIHELLAIGGYALVAVPNSRSLAARLFRSRWYHLDCPRHYHLWTPTSLRALLEKRGLTHVSTNFDKSPWGLLGSLQYAVYGDNYRPETMDRLRGNLFVAPLFLPLTFPLGLMHYGDTMVICAQRAT
jgi:SAM-dependent methyltransferase